MNGFLHGMKQPAAKDEVFRSAMLRRGATIKARQEFHSLDVEADQRGVARGGDPAQIHRELVIFDESRIYPEFIVWYRLDSEEEQKLREALSKFLSP